MGFGTKKNIWLDFGLIRIKKFVIVTLPCVYAAELATNVRHVSWSEKPLLELKDGIS